ncbi:hypothetical protein [Nocardia sp. NPDC051570]|uniref:hypothetical protein n=1 Tax=Nocardia sp. NPDC051570 TaxID=3364324 RepID=UPI0037BDE043
MTDRAGHPGEGCSYCLAGVDHVFAQCADSPAVSYASPANVSDVRRNGRGGRHDTKEFCVVLS